MMSMTDQDLELLEAYVDGELSGADEEELRRRLDAEPGLAAALETLRAEAHVRSQVWKGYEPDETAVRRLIARVDASVDRNTIWAHRLSKIRGVSAAAACIVLGVFIGHAAFSSGPGPGNAPSISNPTRVGVPAGGPPRLATGPQREGPVQYQIVDDSGKAITLQPFSSQKEGEDFLLDLARWQREQEQLRQGGTTLPSTGKF